MLPMLSEHISGRSRAGALQAIVHGHVEAAARSDVDDRAAAFLEPGQERHEGVGIRSGTPVARITRVHMENGGSRASSRDALLRDHVGRYGQGRRHCRRVYSTREGTRDDDSFSLSRHWNAPVSMPS